MEWLEGRVLSSSAVGADPGTDDWYKYLSSVWHENREGRGGIGCR